MTKRILDIHLPDDKINDKVQVHAHLVKCRRCGEGATLFVDPKEQFGYTIECFNPDCKVEPFYSPNLLRGVIIGVTCAMFGWCLTVIAMSRFIAELWR